MTLEFTHDIYQHDVIDLFQERLNRLSFDVYGHYNESYYNDSAFCVENPALKVCLESSQRTLSVNLSDNTSYDQIYCQFNNANDKLIMRMMPYHFDEVTDIEILPNFKAYLPDGQYIAIQWYKFALNDAYSNIELSINLINQLFDHIENQLVESLSNRKD